jgi:O-antigen/teichoic acid export membrane protein
MLNKINKFDHFTKNIIFVFIGTSFANFLNLIYQLLIAHKLSAQDFAAFNSLLAIFMLIASPLGTLQLGIVKFISSSKARESTEKISNFLSYFFSRCLLISAFIALLFFFISPYILSKLKIDSLISGYFLVFLVATVFITPVLSGGIQGLELFKWVVVPSVSGGILKIILTAVFLALGYKITGALGAFLLSNIMVISISYYPLRGFLFKKADCAELKLKEFFTYLIPIAASYLSYTFLITFDMVLVRYYFTAEESGVYAISQMLGKIFLFLPGAISLVLFPRASGLHATNSDTKRVLRQSLFYAFLMCILASIFYNFFPGFVLKVLTGKADAQSILLGRFFSFSMIFFAILYIFINYFISVHDLRFIKYLLLSAVAQFVAIAIFHANILQVQYVLCVNSLAIFIICYFLAFKKKVA